MIKQVIATIFFEISKNSLCHFFPIAWLFFKCVAGYLEVVYRNVENVKRMLVLFPTNGLFRVIEKINGLIHQC